MTDTLVREDVVKAVEAAEAEACDLVTAIEAMLEGKLDEVTYEAVDEKLEAVLNQITNLRRFAKGLGPHDDL
jgi:hypothetical protein